MGGKPRGARLTHFDTAGNARMVSVGAKPETARVAVASCVVLVADATADRIEANAVEKGDVLSIARVAAIAGLKRTPELIPLCHPIRVTGVDVELAVARDKERGALVQVRATVRAFDRTGVEMEALTAASVAALTVYDMCKAADRGMQISSLRLESKSGGRSGNWRRSSG